MSAGDTIALCKGGLWNVANGDSAYNLSNANCAAGDSLTNPANTSTCDIRDYGASWGGTARPVLYANGTGTTYLISRTSGTTNGVRVLNLELRGANPGAVGGGGTYYLSVGIATTQSSLSSDWLVCNTSMNHLYLGYANLYAWSITTGPSTNRWTITGNRFEQNDLDAILGSPGDDGKITANFFDNNGGFTHPNTGNQAHTLYLQRIYNTSGTTYEQSRIEVAHNQFARTRGGSVVECATPILGSHGYWTDLTLENNEIDGGSPLNNCWGLTFSSGSSGSTHYRNFVVRGNRFHAGGVAINIGSAPGVIIENNLISFAGNTFNWNNGISAPEYQDTCTGTCDTMNNVAVRNNTIYMPGLTGTIRGIWVSREGTGHVIANNSVYFGPNGGDCFVTPLAQGAYTFVGNDACYGGTWSTTYDSTEHITADPLYANTVDFMPQVVSSLIGAGTYTYSSTKDFYLKTRSNPPDIGAVSYGGAYKRPSQYYALAQATCSAFPIRSTGTKHYFCDCGTGAENGCVAGSDSNDGLTPATAKQTWSAAITAFNAMSAGDTIALCKGGAFPVGTTDSCGSQLANSNCAAGDSLTNPANTSTCDIRDYQASWGGTGKPTLYASTTGTVRIINRFGTTMSGVRVFGLHFKGGNAGPRGGTYYAHHGISFGACAAGNDNYWLICGNQFDYLQTGMIPALNDTVLSNFNIWGNRFEMNDLDAILGGPGTNGTINANYFDNNGGFSHPSTGNYAHTVYITSPSGETTGASVVNNEFRRSADGTTPPGECRSAILVGHDHFDGLIVENNLIDGGTLANANCWGMDLRAAASGPTYYRNTIIRRNWVKSGVGIVLGQAPNSTIENNVVVAIGNYAWKHGIISPYDVARAQDDVENNVLIRNNTIYMMGSGSGDAAGIRVPDEGTGHVIANNTVYSQAGTCFDTPLTEGAYAFIGNNACYGGASWGTTYDHTEHITANPLYTNPPIDFTPQAASSLINAGSYSYGSTKDFYIRTRSNPPDVGAVERP